MTEKLALAVSVVELENGARILYPVVPLWRRRPAVAPVTALAALPVVIWSEFAALAWSQAALQLRLAAAALESAARAGR